MKHREPMEATPLSPGGKRERSVAGVARKMKEWFDAL